MTSPRLTCCLVAYVGTDRLAALLVIVSLFQDRLREDRVDRVVVPRIAFRTIYHICQTCLPVNMVARTTV
jgi:hypothetical protein